jgi:hypothetical protein
MPKKVLPFPAPRQVETPIACHHSRVNVRVGTQNFAIDITTQATILPSAPAGPVQQLRVETVTLYEIPLCGIMADRFLLDTTKPVPERLREAIEEWRHAGTPKAP